MRWLAQLSAGLFGLALAAPAWSQSVSTGMEAPAFAETAPASVSAPVAASRHQHRGLFGARYCVECQRARAKRVDGVDVPPPPSSASVPGGTVMPGTVVYENGHDHAHPGESHVHQAASSAPASTCVACEQAAGATVVTNGPAMADPSAPGYASVGGASVGGASAPGYASVGGPSPVGGDASPSPIGVARAHTGSATMPSSFSVRPGMGTQDPSVMPTSASAAIPAAPTPMGDNGPTHPRILSHLFGFSDMARERRERRGKKAQQERDDHAAIAYDEKTQPIAEIPASMVYGSKPGH